MKDAILVQRIGSIAKLQVNRPAVRNAMTFSMYDELASHCQRIGKDREIRALVLEASGAKAFVSGTDINDLSSVRTGEDGLQYERRVDAALDALERVPQPVLCVLRGYVAGGGLAIASACDVRIATGDMLIGVPIARGLGNIVSGATLARLVSSLGEATVRRLLVVGDFVSADDARALGFVTEIVDDESVDDRVREIAERVARNSPTSIAAAKTALRRIREISTPEMDDLIRDCYGSDGFREGVSAFLAKREPVWPEDK